MTRLRRVEWAVLVGFVLFVSLAVWWEVSGWSDDPDEDYAWLEAQETYEAISNAWVYYLTEQEASDAAFEGWEISGQRWRNEHHFRRIERASAVRFLLAGMPDVGGEEETPLDQWYAAIEAAEDFGGRTEWDLVDQWFRGQPADVQAYIERNIGPQETPTEREHRELLREMKETGFFAIEEEAWAELREAPVVADAAIAVYKTMTWREFRDAMVVEIQRAMLDEGVDPRLARGRAEDQFDDKSPIPKVILEEMSYRRSVWETEYPQGAAVARKFGYIQ